MRRQEWLLPAGLSPKVGTRPPLLVGCPAGGSPLWVSLGWAAPLKTVSLGGGELSLYLGILRRRRFQSRFSKAEAFEVHRQVSPLGETTSTLCWWRDATTHWPASEAWSFCSRAVSWIGESSHSPIVLEITGHDPSRRESQDDESHVYDLAGRGLRRHGLESFHFQDLNPDGPPASYVQKAISNQLVIATPLARPP